MRAKFECNIVIRRLIALWIVFSPRSAPLFVFFNELQWSLCFVEMYSNLGDTKYSQQDVELVAGCGRSFTLCYANWTLTSDDEPFFEPHALLHLQLTFHVAPSSSVRLAPQRYNFLGVFRYHFDFYFRKNIVSVSIPWVARCYLIVVRYRWCESK